MSKSETIGSLAVFSLLLMLSGCQFFHDTTAKFNAYFLANERMLEVEESLFGNPETDYNDVLQVLVPLDTNTGKSQKANLDYVIEMASLPIQWHKSSKWVDDCYILVGKSRLYQGDFTNAVTTLKYVNTKSEDNDARHEALIVLMRAFLESGELNNMEYVRNYIKKEKAPFNEENTRHYHMIMAHYYRMRYELDMVAQHLEMALIVTKQKKKKARIHYILAQIYYRFGEEEKAYDHYAKVLKSKPSLEMEFHARMMATALKPYRSPEEIAKVEKYFKRLAKDQKNWEYRDRIFYQRGLLMLRLDSVDKCMDYLEESIEVSTSNTTQKAYSYLKKGDIYYTIKKNYVKAAEYYKMGAELLPETAHNYKAIQARAEMLNDFAKWYVKVQEQERLLKLADMPESELVDYLEKEIEDEKEEILREKERERAIAKKRRKPIQTSSVAKVSKSDDKAWVFYKDDDMAKGNSAFIRKWGPRKLEDNWRRARKEISFDEAEEADLPQADASPKGKKGGEDGDEDIFAEVKSLEERLKEIPKKEGEFEKVYTDHEEALFNLAKVYNFQITDTSKAIATFTKQGDLYLMGVNTPEALYILYKICLTYPKCSSGKPKDLLLTNHPESIWAKLIINPNYIEDKNRETAFIASEYKRAFKLFKNGAYSSAMSVAEGLIEKYPEDGLIDRINLLKVMLIGKTSEEIGDYYIAIMQFQKDFPESELKGFSDGLLDAFSEGEIDRGKVHWQRYQDANKKKEGDIKDEGDKN